MNAQTVSKPPLAPGTQRLLSLLLLLCLLSLPRGLSAQSSPDDDAFTGIPAWRHALGGSAIGRPLAQVESVVVATDGGNLLSFSSQGRQLWNFFARGRLTPYISRSREGTSYIGRTNGLLIAINRSGREIWHYDLRSPLVSPVLIGWDGRLFVFTDRRITCMTAAGYVLWSRTLEARAALPPILDAAGGIILVQENGEVLRLDAFGNAFSHSAGTVPAAAASLKLEGRGHAILLLYSDWRMELIYDFDSGEPLRGVINFPSPPVAAVGKGAEAAVLLRDGRVALVAPEEQQIRWISETHIRAGDLPARPGPVDIDLFYDDRGVYVLTRGGATGFLPDGRRLWVVQLRGAATIPTFGDDGMLYSGGTDWILNAYRLEQRIRTQERPLHGALPAGSYGTANPGPSPWADCFFRFEEREMRQRFQSVHRAIRTGTVGASEKMYKAWLMEIAGSRLRNPFQRPVPSNSLPDLRHRIEAARLLASIGSRETIPFLTDLFNRDPEPLVRAAAAEAIGRIGVDPDGIALRAFANAIFPPSALRNEAVLTAVAGAIGALCRFSGPPLSGTGIWLLAALAESYDLPRAMRQARLEMQSLTN